MSEMWIILWSSGGGVYPCIILSRCFWQHTSEIHSGWVLITAGLGFPPFMCPPAGPSVHDSSKKSSTVLLQILLGPAPPCRRPLLPLPLGRWTRCGHPRSWLTTETLSYVRTSRANTRRRARQGGREEDWHRRAFTETERRADVRARSSRGENRVRSHSAQPSHIHPPPPPPPLRAHGTDHTVHYQTLAAVWNNRGLLAAPRPGSPSLCLRVASAPTPEVLRPEKLDEIFSPFLCCCTI